MRHAKVIRSERHTAEPRHCIEGAKSVQRGEALDHRFDKRSTARWKVRARSAHGSKCRVNTLSFEAYASRRQPNSPPSSPPGQASPMAPIKPTHFQCLRSRQRWRLTSLTDVEALSLFITPYERSMIATFA